MGEQSKIAWCDSTLNFWSGCTKVSAGCTNCYAEVLSNRGLTDAKGKLTIGKWGKGASRQLHESAFKLAHRLNRKPWVCDTCGQAAADKSWCMECGEHASYHRRRNFSLSLGDILDPEVKIEWFARTLDTVRKCPDCDWLLCTKRPELFGVRLEEAQDYDYDHGKRELCGWLRDWRTGQSIPQNIVLLTSVENQAAADKRIPELLRIPAWRRGLSCEPLLGLVDLQFFEKTWRADWVIVGGESGNKARPCNVEWVRSLKDQCAAAGVPCFVKQLGANSFKPSKGEVIKFLRDPKGGDLNEWPGDLKVREFYK